MPDYGMNPHSGSPGGCNPDKERHRQRNSLEINEAIEFYGASLKVSPNNDYTIVTLHSLTKHLPDLLPVVREILAEATFPEEELQLYIQNAQQRLAVSLRQSEFVANRHIDAYLFAGNTLMAALQKLPICWPWIPPHCVTFIKGTIMPATAAFLWPEKLTKAMSPYWKNISEKIPGVPRTTAPLILIRQRLPQSVNSVSVMMKTVCRAPYG
jgi:hypothetical protein